MGWIGYILVRSRDRQRWRDLRSIGRDRLEQHTTGTQNWGILLAAIFLAAGLAYGAVLFSIIGLLLVLFVLGILK